jgi:hypothetical protein
VFTMEGQPKDDRAQTSQGRLNPMPQSEALPPPVLYKYYAFKEWTQSIFEQDKMYFQSSDCLNDPLIATTRSRGRKWLRNRSQSRRIGDMRMSGGERVRA